MRVIDYINQGGAIMYILLLLNIVGFAIMITKFFVLTKESKNVSGVAHKLAEAINGKKSNAAAAIEIAKGEIQSYMGGLEKGLNTIKIIASISPLLGLLGTVVGVLIAFKVMSQSGLNNPALFAEGISMALITTVGGLIVAIPHYIGHNYLTGIIDNLEGKIEKEILPKVL